MDSGGPSMPPAHARLSDRLPGQTRGAHTNAGSTRPTAARLEISPRLLLAPLPRNPTPSEGTGDHDESMAKAHSPREPKLATLGCVALRNRERESDPASHRPLPGCHETGETELVHHTQGRQDDGGPSRRHGQGSELATTPSQSSSIDVANRSSNPQTRRAESPKPHLLTPKSVGKRPGIGDSTSGTWVLRPPKAIHTPSRFGL